MKNKIDRLFQDKLARHATTPSLEAWEQVRTEISGESNLKVWIGIAASLILIGVSAALIFNNSESSSMEFSVSVTSNGPAPLADYQWNLPETITKVVEEEQPEKERLKEVSTEVRHESRTALAVIESENLVENNEESIENQLDIVPQPELIEGTALVKEKTIPRIVEEELLPQLQVQITYRASESPITTNEEKTKVGKLLAKARQIKPGEMLASIRETKNDFFNNKRN